MGMLSDVLDWCREHPADETIPEPEALTLRRHADGSLTVLGDPPTVIAVSAELLDVANLDRIGFDDGVLTIDVQPGPQRYRPLGPLPYLHAVAFQRIRDEAEG